MEVTLPRLHKSALDCHYGVIIEAMPKKPSSSSPSSSLPSSYRYKPLTDYIFKLETCVLQVIKVYKYLGLLFVECVTFDETVQVLSDSAERALDVIVADFKNITDSEYKTHTKLYNCGVSPILHYTMEVWGGGG